MDKIPVDEEQHMDWCVVATMPIVPDIVFVNNYWTSTIAVIPDIEFDIN